MAAGAVDCFTGFRRWSGVVQGWFFWRLTSELEFRHQSCLPGPQFPHLQEKENHACFAVYFWGPERVCKPHYTVESSINAGWYCLNPEVFRNYVLGLWAFLGILFLSTAPPSQWPCHFLHLPSQPLAWQPPTAAPGVRCRCASPVLFPTPLGALLVSPMKTSVPHPSPQGPLPVWVLDA